MAADMPGQGSSAAPRSAPSAAQAAQPCPAAGSKRGGAKRVCFSAALAAEAGRVDDTYFDSYSCFDIHREMLADKVCYNAFTASVSPADVVSSSHL